MGFLANVWAPEESNRLFVLSCYKPGLGMGRIFDNFGRTAVNASVNGDSADRRRSSF